MTIKEAVIATLQITGYADGAIEKALLDSGLNGEDTYTATMKQSIGLAAIEVLQGMLSLASVSEGGYSISYSVAGIKLRLDYLNGIYGEVTDDVPTVKSPSVW